MKPSVCKLPRWVYRDVDRHGVERFYFRRLRGPGARKILLGHDPEHPSFWEAYAAAVSAAPVRLMAPAEDPARPAAGSLRKLVADYVASADFRRLDPETVKAQRNVLEACCREPLNAKSQLTIGGTPLAIFGAAHVEALRDRKTDAPNAANQRLKALKRMFKWAIASKYQVEGRPLRVNPVAGVERIRIVTQGHHTWSMDEVRQYEAAHPVGTKARVALGLFLYLGQRISDVHVLGRQHERGGVLRFTQHKNRNRAPVHMELPILPALRAILEAGPTGDLTYLVTDHGRPFASAKSFANKFKDWCRAAGLPERCTAHGLRKAGACLAAENGATEAEMMAIFGWTDTRMAALYIRQANRGRLAHASIHKLMDRTLSEQNGPTFLSAAGKVGPKSEKTL